MGWRRKRVKRDAPTGRKKKVPDFGKPKGRQIIGQIKQFRVKLWLEEEEENALGLRQSSWVLGLNVTLRQQKLYKTTFDGHLAPPPARRKPRSSRPAPRPRERGESGLAPPGPGNMATEAWCAAGGRGKLAHQAGRTPLPRAAYVGGWGGRGGRGEGCCRETWGGGREHCLLGAPPRASLHNLAPRSPAAPRVVGTQRTSELD